MKKVRKISLIVLSFILVFTLMACSKDNEEDLDKDTVEVEVEEEEEESVVEPKKENVKDEIYVDFIEERVESSDYISKVVLVDLGEGKKELKLLEDIKGDLSQANLAEIQGMEEDTEYLIFLRDVEGLVDLTDNRSLIILEEDGQELIDEVKEILNKN